MKNIIFIILFLIPVSALAKDSVVKEIDVLLDFQDSPRYVLPSVPTTEIDGTLYKCLTVDEWKTVLQISNSFHGLYDWRLQVHSILLAQQDIVMAYELKISSYEQSMATHEANRDYLSTRLDNEKTWNLKLNKSKGIEILAWKIVAGLELAAIVAMSVASSIRQ
jgi:hypothetical protein